MREEEKEEQAMASEQNSVLSIAFYYVGTLQEEDRVGVTYKWTVGFILFYLNMHKVTYLCIKIAQIILVSGARDRNDT